MPDKTPEDDDDDIPDYFNLEKTRDHFNTLSTCLPFNDQWFSFNHASVVERPLTNIVYSEIISSLGYYLHLARFTPF